MCIKYWYVSILTRAPLFLYVDGYQGTILSKSPPPHVVVLSPVRPTVNSSATQPALLPYPGLSSTCSGTQLPSLANIQRPKKSKSKKSTFVRTTEIKFAGEI